MTSFIFQILGSFLHLPKFRSTHYECKHCHQKYPYLALHDLCVQDHALEAIKGAQKTFKKVSGSSWRLMHCGSYYICPLDWRIFSKHRIASQHFKACLSEHRIVENEDNAALVEIEIALKPAEELLEFEATDTAPTKEENTKNTINSAKTNQASPKSNSSGVWQDGLQYICTNCQKSYWIKGDAENCFKGHKLP